MVEDSHNLMEFLNTLVRAKHLARLPTAPLQMSDRFARAFDMC